MKNTFLLLSLIAFGSYSSAANLTATPKATATLSSSCQINANDISLGNIMPGQASSTGTGTFSVQCTNSTAYKYYIGITQWGNDCVYLLGKNTGDKMLYGIKDLQTGASTGNNVNGNAGSGVLTPMIGNGSSQSLSFQVFIQQNALNFTSCKTPLKSPGQGYNPYVSPDDYTDTLTFGIIY